MYKNIFSRNLFVVLLHDCHHLRGPNLWYAYSHLGRWKYTWPVKIDFLLFFSKFYKYHRVNIRTQSRHVNVASEETKIPSKRSTDFMLNKRLRLSTSRVWVACIEVHMHSLSFQGLSMSGKVCNAFAVLKYAYLGAIQVRCQSPYGETSYTIYA